MEISIELCERLLNYLRVQAEVWTGISDIDHDKAIELMQALIEARDNSNVSND